LLDESKAQVRMLIAPAGYGKTTLAEQWVGRDDRTGVWYTARSASTDVAALALGIARAATGLIEDADHRLREHLRAVPAPAENVRTLAEILSEDLAEWPRNAWLVLDDYHEITPEPKAEAFIEALVALSPVQFLIASRLRPSWVASKHVLYGDVLELAQAALAMDSDEAMQILADRSSSSVAGLTALAQGWPAVIGLASASDAEIGAPADQVPESLYRFFADEVFGALDESVQQSLAQLSVIPNLDREIIEALLGDAEADATCDAALDVGLFVERGAHLELHPLARVFLDERNQPRPVDRRIVEKCLQIYLGRKEWDPAFELLRRAKRTDLLGLLIEASLDDLLETARLSTLEAWCKLAEQSGPETAISQLARAEVRLRDGRLLEAAAFAEMAAEDIGLSFRALSVAGRASHLAGREEAGLELFRRAEGNATTEKDRRDAQWGQLACAIDLDAPDAASAFDRLSAGVSFANVREVVRMATHRTYLQLRTGSLQLEDADVAWQVVDAVRDPLVETSFLSAYSIALALAARYQDAQSAAESLWRKAKELRFDFACPYALCAKAMACAGRRMWSDAEAAAEEALERAVRLRDAHAVLLGQSVLIRILVQQNQLSRALAIPIADSQAALDASIAEALCSRALGLACIGRLDHARELISGVARTSRAVEPAVLIPAVEAACAIRGGDADSIERAAAVRRAAFESGAVDLLVTTYRSCPELVPILLREEGSWQFRDLMARVGDSDLAQAVGDPIASDDDRRLLLSPREREVYELLRTGLSNRQIASMLFIEESTVKVHAHHIYDKLGVRSRKALTVQAALERRAQATSAIETSSEAGSSEL
jgi:ATP/maltotriose-dependent transcriptional regulator MalT